MNTPLGILCGGLGTRMRERFGSRQKTTLKVDDSRTVLEIVINNYYNAGFREFCLLAGYQSQEISKLVQKFKEIWRDALFDVWREERSLGTGGAVKNWLTSYNERWDHCFVCNGDTLITSNLNKSDYSLCRRDFLATVIGHPVDASRDDAGYFNVNAAEEILSFGRKEPGPESFQNSGLYVLDYNIMNFLTSFDDSFSWEKDFLSCLDGGLLGAYIDTEGFSFDLGVPERFDKFCSAWVPEE
jgi:NDP-sugar pyrophosphorylase family protein